MSVRTDVINLNVNINGNAAQNDLNNLRKKAADLKLEMEGLNKRTAEYKAKKAELREVEAQMTSLKQQIGLASLSQKELVAELNKLKALKGSVVPFSNEFKELDKQIKAVESRLYDVRNGVQGFSSFFSKIKDEVKQFGVMAAGYLGFQFITSSFQNIIQGAAKTSDQLADLRKSAGFSGEEVKKFNQELSKIDTRTSVSSLREIAKVGGQLGIAKEDLLGFTKAIDKLSVALGDEFAGGAEEITNVVGKLRNTFSDIRSDKVDEDLLHIGNALNVLGAAGIATAPVVSDFAQRIGAAGQVYGLTAGQTFGLSAALQEMGITAERGSTAVVKILQKLSQSPELFLQVAQSVDPSIKSLDQFKTLINTDISKAFTIVAQGFSQSKGSATAFAEQLSDANVSGAAITEVLAKVGQNSQLVADKINLATGALKDQSSIQSEFAIKNENFGATLDKLGKELTGIAAKFTGFAQAVVNGLVSFIGILKDLPRFIGDNRTAFIALTGVILTYVAAKTRATQSAILNRAATLLETGADKLEAAQKAINIALTNAYAFAKDVLTGKIKLATVAQRIWNAVASANPLAIIIGLAAAAATAISFFTSKVEKSTEAEQNHADVLADVKSQTEATKSQIETLTKVITSSTASTEEKAKALEKLKSISHEYLDGLTQENITQTEGINIIKKYIQSLDALADAKARVNLKAKLKEQLLESDNNLSGLEVEKAGKPQLSAAQKFFNGADGKFFGMGDRNRYDVEQDIKKEQESRQKIANRLKALDTDNDKQIEAYRKSIADKQTQLKGLQKDSDGAKKLARDIASDQKVLFTLTGLDDGATNLPGAGGNNTPKADGSVGALRQKLQAQLDALKSAYEKIDALNTKAREKNLAEQKKVQDQLTRLDGKETKSDKSADSQYKQLKKEADKFYQDLLKLKQQAEIKGEEPEQKEIDAVKNKYEELAKKAKDFFLKGVITKKQFGDEEVLIEESKQQEINAIFQKFYKQRLDASNQKEYEQSLLASQQYYDEQRKQAAESFAANKLTKQQYDAELRKLDQHELSDRITIADNYSEHVKKASEDVKNFRKQQEQQTTKDLIEETQKRKETADQEKLASAQRGVLTAKGKGVNAEVDAKKNLLQTAFDLDTQYLDKKSELYKQKEDELQQSIADADKEGTLKKIDNVLVYVGYFQQALDGLNQVLSNSENKQLAKEKKANEEKKKDLKKQLDSKLISQAQYDKKVQELDEQQQKHENEIKRKQAIREKAINVFNAIVNNAAAIIKTMASVPFPANIPLAIAQGIAGGLQVAAIKNAPLPELGVGDWIRKGDKHKDASRGIPVMIERDEAVMNAAAMTDPDVVTVTGTTAQITSALNARKGRGVNWAGGAVVQMPKWRTDKPAQINPGLVRYMATGGLGSGQTSAAGTAGSMEETNALLKQLIAKQDENTQEVKTMKTKLHAVVSIKEYREEEAKYNAAQKASSIAS